MGRRLYVEEGFMVVEGVVDRGEGSAAGVEEGILNFRVPGVSGG